MPINFPSSPTLNQNYTVGTKTWVWNGYAWDIQPIDTIILGADTLARAAYGEANTQNVINQTQNTWITNTNTFAQAAFNKANTGSGNDLAQAAFNTANTAGANTVALQSVNSTQNTNITSINTFAGSAFASANAGVTLATAAYGQANNASGNTVALQSQMTTTNTNITAVNTFAGSAFNSANAGVTLATAAFAVANAPFQIKTQTTSNSAYYYLTMVDSDNATSNTETLYTDGALQWYPSLNLMLFNNATLSFTDGNQACTYLGFGTSIDTKFFYNGTANTLNLELESDAVSFHITDNGTDDFVFYKANGNLRLFSTEDTNGSIILGPSGSVNVGTGGIVFSDGTSQRTESLTAAQAAYASANAGVTLATAAYDKANTGGGGGSAIGITNDTATNNTIFVLLTTQSSGNLTIANTSSSKLTYNPNTGTLSATVFSSTSDESLKENIKTIENPINTIMQLRGVTYIWKDSKEESLGLIAQEVEKVLPTVVRQSDNKKTVDYSNMIGLLVEAIKEQQKQIDDLKHQLNKHLK